MARIDSLANFLEDVATKIRSKTGSQSTITPANYDTEIEKIKFKPTGNLIVNDVPVANITFEQGTSTVTTFDSKNLDTSEMTNMSNMFRNCIGLTTLDLSPFDTSNVENMSSMFGGCTNLTNIDLSSFDTSNVVKISAMFSNCSSLISLNLSSFNTSSVENMSSMFNGCTNLETITFGNNFTFVGITGTGLSNMFQKCTKLDDNTLNAILHLCTTATSAYTSNKTLNKLGITSSFDNFNNIPNLSNYQAFLDAGWTIS